MTSNYQELDFARSYLKTIQSRLKSEPAQTEAIFDLLSSRKDDAVRAGDQDAAKDVWCIETILKIQEKYLLAYQHLKAGEYYRAWCVFAEIENLIDILSKHYDITCDEYQVAFIDRHIGQFQELYPYRLFLSPGMITSDKSCSICGQRVSIRNPCGHQVGQIYDGQLCHRVVNKAIPIEISLVTNPVQKYSVAFFSKSRLQSIEEADQYDYSAIAYVVKALNSPFDAWGYRITQSRHPHRFFSHIKPSDQCPCGSEMTYADCCLKSSGVLRPHREFFFSVEPPEDLPEIEYPYEE